MLVSRWTERGDIEQDPGGGTPELLPDRIPTPNIGHTHRSAIILAHGTAIKTAIDLHDGSAPIVCDTVIRCPDTRLRLVTPFRASAWLQLLAGHPDGNWAHRLVYDLVHGVDIGFRDPRLHRRESRNMTASPAEDAAMTNDLIAEVALHHIAGPYRQPPSSTTSARP